MLKLLIYLEDAPLGPSVASTGLSKAFNASISSLLGEKVVLCINQTHEWYDPIHYIEECSYLLSWISTRFDWYFAKLCRHLPWEVACWLTIVHSKFIAMRIHRFLANKITSDTKLIAPVGVDPFSILRASQIAKNLSLKFEPYIVDDIEFHPENMKYRDNISKMLSSTLKECTKVFAITDGLGNLIKQRYKVSSITLNLVADNKYKCNYNNSRHDWNVDNFFAFYLGSINHLYAPGLILLINVISKLRNATGKNLKIRLSSNVNQVLKQIGSVPEWVTVGQISDSDHIIREISGSKFCFLSYCFDESSRNMVESSFPSKLIDYLSYGANILIFAPRYSMPYKIFQTKKLPHICSEIDCLERKIFDLAQDDSSSSNQYHLLIDDIFSSANFRNTLGLNNDS